jgi:hypothetical protein
LFTGKDLSLYNRYNHRIMKISQLTLLIVLVVLLNACKKTGADKPATSKKLKYLTQIISTDGTTTYFTNYTYDDKKRLSTIKSDGATITYTYNGDDVISIEKSYPPDRKELYELTYADGKLQTMSVKGYEDNSYVGETSYGFVYNGDKLTEIHQDGHVDYYTYDNNVVKQQGEGFAITYSYDNKKSKFANLPPALKNIAFQIRQPDYFSSNNLISTDRGVNGISSVTYVYDSDGYPTGTVDGDSRSTYVYTEM